MTRTAAQIAAIESRGGHELRHAPPELERELAAAVSVARPWPIEQACSTEFRALRTSGSRRLETIGLAVIHCTQGSTALGAASWFTNPDAQGSAHLVVDGTRCYRTLPPSVICWGAPGTNLRGWHIELAGFAEWTGATWLGHPGTLERAAYKVALHCHEFHIPPRFLTDRELARGEDGICSHRGATRVFGGTHTDPGGAFPWERFLPRVTAYYGAL